MESPQKRREIYNISTQLREENKLTELMEYLFCFMDEEGSFDELYLQLQEYYDEAEDEKFLEIFNEIMKAFE